MTNCPQCEYHKNRAARWRAEAYKQSGHDVIELPWRGLTAEEAAECWTTNAIQTWKNIEAKLKEKNT